jgi:GNAT superfamily N-acetyltransferase
VSGNAVREAVAADVPALVALMQEFYAESGYPLDAAAAGRTFDALLAAPALGRAWLLLADEVPAGFVVLTVSFSMEYGGLHGAVDDLFVRPDARRRGLADAGLATLRAAALERGVRAVHVEVGPDSGAGLRLY